MKHKEDDISPTTPHTNADDFSQTLNDDSAVFEECNTGLISTTNSHIKTRDDYDNENLHDFNNEDWLNLSCLFDIHECNTGPQNKMKHKEDDISPTIPHTNADDFSQTRRSKQ